MSRTQPSPEAIEQQRRDDCCRSIADVCLAPYERLNAVLQNTTFRAFAPGISLESCMPYLQIDEAIRGGQTPPDWAIREELQSYRQFFVDIPRRLIESIRAWLPIEGQPDCPPVYKSESTILQEIREDLAVFQALRSLFMARHADSIRDRRYTPSLTTLVLDRWPKLNEAQVAVSLAFAQLTEPYEFMEPDDWRYSDSLPCRTKLPPLL